MPPVDVALQNYGIFVNDRSVCLAVFIGRDQRVDIEMSHEQAAHMAMRLREALAMGPQVAAPQ